MNGECKSYRLNDPMTLDEFMSMPDDIKCTYIKLIRKKFNAPVTQIAKMMGVSEATVRKELKRLGLNEGKTRSGKTKWDKEGFYAWWHGVDKLPEPVVEEVAITQEEEYVEEDLPFAEPEAVVEEDIPCFELLQSQGEEAFGSIRQNYAELAAELEKANAENHWLRNECKDIQMQVRILEAQMEVVRLIFGGDNRA